MTLEKDLVAQLNWRYATKRMNGTAVPQEKVEAILEAIRLAPVSYGFQNFKVLVIEDAATRAKIAPAAYNQPQLHEGSHLLVFAVEETLTEAQADAYMANIAQTRGIDVSALADFKAALMHQITSKTPEQQVEWASKQVYLALGIAIAAAALAKVDATPMEGFNPAAVDEILDLKAKGLRSVVLLALGYRDEANDFLANAPKVRQAKSEMFETI